MSKKEQILEYFKDINVAYNDYTMHDTLEHMLEDLEEVRRGHWETVFMSEATGYDPTLANYIDTVFCHRCSVCKEDARLDEFGEEMISKYCPNCGAKMDEGGEDAKNN